MPAGEWHLVADGIIIEAVDVTFELLWRRDGRADVEIASWNHHFDPIGGGAFEAQPFEDTAQGAAIDFEAGDLLVFRYSGESATSPTAYIPNGDGDLQGGRIPFIDLPQ